MLRLLQLVLLLAPLLSVAQQDPQFSQYMFNPYLWNPAYPGLKNDYIVSFHHRTQWLGYTSTDAPSISPPSTQFLTATAPLQKWNSGLGLGFMNDQIGPIKNQALFLTYAYRLNLGEGKLSFGLGIGGQSISLNSDLWRPENPNDPTLAANGTLNQLRPNFRFGVGYELNNFYIGFASNHVANPAYSFGRNFQSSLERHFYLQSAYKITLSEVLSLQPSILAKHVSGTTSMEVSNLFLIDIFWAGLSFRTSDALILLAGVNLLPDKSLRIGYNFDLTVINKQAKATSSHEIFLSYNFLSVLDNRKPIIRSPRFRF